MLAVGLAAGFAMHRSDFCIAGAFRDVFLFGSTFMLKMTGIAVLAAMALIEALRVTGIAPSVAGGPPTLGNLPGGIIFGFGMVLAGGCAVGILYKTGAGNASALAALAGAVTGSGLYAELHPALLPFTTGALGTKATTLPQLLELSPALPAGLTVAAGGWFLFRMARKGELSRGGSARGYIEPWITASLLALLTAGAVAVTGMPLGITTFYAKTAAWLENLAAPGHVSSLAYFGAAGFKLTTPLGIEIKGGAGPVFDSIALIQGATIAGILGGSFLSSLALGEFRPRFAIPARHYLTAFAGGVILALGARIGFGCNVWYVLGGLPAFKLQAVLFTAGLFPGAWLGGLLLKRLI